MSTGPRALVLNAPGINCNAETGFAIERAGGVVDQVHISQWQAGEVSLHDYQMLVLSGGFSYGDDISSGRILGMELRVRFAEEINRFVAARKVVLGICNGFQVLVESGLLPEGRILPIDSSDSSAGDPVKSMSLISNANNSFECRWNGLQVKDSVCKFISPEFVGKVVELPSAHQEGRIVVRDGVLDGLSEAGQIVFSFVNANGNPTEAYPDNPNGSYRGITGVCDPSGVVLGLMPHPERAIRHTQHPNWRRGEGQNPFGMELFKGMVDYAKGL